MRGQRSSVRSTLTKAHRTAMTSASGSSPSTASSGRKGIYQPIVIGGDELEDEGAHELALQTFYQEEDQYDDLHRRWYRTSKEGRELMEKDGLVWKKGRWSVQELRLLKRNVKAFMKENRVKEIATFILSMGRSNHRREHRNFYQFIGKGIQRPLFFIYRKAIQVFNVQNYVGRWTEEMDRELTRLHEIHGNRWAEIGRHMGTTGRAVLDRFRSLRNPRKGGRWSEEEEQKLFDVMATLRQEHGGEGDDLPPSVSWRDVASKVGTRTEMQCHQKWVSSLSWKRSPGAGVKWTKSDDLKLICVLASLEGVEEEEEVDWEGLCEGWPAAHNAHYVRMKWGAIRRDVPHYNVQTLQENLEYLMSNSVPALSKAH